MSDNNASRIAWVIIFVSLMTGCTLVTVLPGARATCEAK